MVKTKLAIIGSGPAGYTAAIYAARAQLSPVVFTGLNSGGQLMWTSVVENFPGFPAGIRGPELMKSLRAQATNFGAEILDESISRLDLAQRPFKLWTKDEAAEAEIEAEAIIIATGASSVMLGVKGEKELLGQGVSTCAVCDAAFYRDQDVVVVGGGDSAMEDALALTKFAKTITLVHRRSEFKASKIMQERVLNHPKIKVKWLSQVTEILGQNQVEAVRLNVDGQAEELKVSGVFIAIGHRPQTALLAGQLQLDQAGYLVTRQSLSREGLSLAQKNLDDLGLIKFPTMTSVEGVLAAGDVVDVRYKQAISAAGMGCQAAIDAERWLA